MKIVFRHIEDIEEEEEEVIFYFLFLIQFRL